jgi:prepilin-type N-terminal cleavage/methylation domain-containing protein/prepilin-type processing-associated H-X9-DG protein
MDKGKGFSLLELLMVMMIIAVVFAVTTPGVYKSREQARTTNCINNMRQIINAALLYADENDDIIPDVAPPVTSPADAISDLPSFDNCDEVFLCKEDPRTPSEFGAFKTSYTAWDSTPTRFRPNEMGDSSTFTIIYVESDLAGTTTRDNISASDIDFWHNNRTIVAFADGHVGSYTSGQLQGAASLPPGSPAESGCGGCTGLIH